MVEEEQLVERLVPRIEEKIRYRVVRSIINALEEQFYPPEEMFREEFVKSVEEAEKAIKEGKSKRYSYDEFKKEFLAVE
jgi:lipoate-protein ligase A